MCTGTSKDLTVGQKNRIRSGLQCTSGWFAPASLGRWFLRGTSR
jgi:hypothetical protein